jgi:hypothetical protein
MQDGTGTIQDRPSRATLSNNSLIFEHVTFNHGVVDSSPTALTKLSPFYEGFTKNSPHSVGRNANLVRYAGRQFLENDTI